MKKILCFACGFLSLMFLQAQIIHVPADFAKIQDAINAANPGETVVVSNGTYFEQINFLGKKNLTVASEYITDGDSSHIGNTIIDGSIIATPESASVVNFISGEDTTSVLCGFTIKNGKGTYWEGLTNTWNLGGGVLILNSGAKLIYNHITENHLSDSCYGSPQLIEGAGIACIGDSTKWLVLMHNRITNNSCHDSATLKAEGGGIEINGTNIRMVYNEVSYNNCINTGTGYSIAGGFSFLGYGQTEAIVQNNIMKFNKSLSNSLFAYNGLGSIENMTTYFSNNEVAFNECGWQNSSSGGIGGISLIDICAGTRISNNNFHENKAITYAGALNIQVNSNVKNTGYVIMENNLFLSNRAKFGGAVTIYGRTVILQNNVFTDNIASSTGGAFYISRSYSTGFKHLAVIENNSFYNNSAGLKGGIIYSYYSKPLIFNSILYNDEAVADTDDICLSNYDTAEIAYCNVNINNIGGAGFLRNGGGNIFMKPLFKDPILLEIENSSPCIDKGTASYTCHCGTTHECPDKDIAGISRPAGLGYDIGAYEIAQGGGINENQKNVLLVKQWPDPVRDIANFSYTLTTPENVSLRIYDNTGRLVGEQSENHKQAGEQKIYLNAANFKAGLYYYSIEAGGNTGTGKFIKK